MHRAWTLHVEDPETRRAEEHCPVAAGLASGSGIGGGGIQPYKVRCIFKYQSFSIVSRLQVLVNKCKIKVRH